MKDIITKFLVIRAKAHLAKTNTKVVAIAGSVGKTSVTQATAKILSQKYKVKTTKGNYNTDIGVVLTIFDETVQTNPISWAITIAKIFFKSFSKPTSDVYVLELGTDKPGDIAKFAYLKPDFGIITAVAPEHMEFFYDIESVAKEELSLTEFCKKTYIGLDVSQEFIEKYGGGSTERVGQLTNAKLSGFSVLENVASVEIDTSDGKLSYQSKVVAKHLVSGLLAPISVAKELGLSNDEIKVALENIEPLPGRMQILHGLNESMIIDDTYNSSPEAVKKALDVLYEYPANKRIVLLGMMNELGESSKVHHEDVGNYCDSSKLELVVTLGADANQYTAPAATSRGCRVLSAKSAMEAAEIIKNYMGPGTVLLAKGSQNGVYAEEAVKLLLENQSDASKLVRQNDYWPEKKKKYFSQVSDI